jgi:hypothetical protein
MPKIEDELKQEFIKAVLNNPQIPSTEWIADYWISCLSQYHKTKLEELEKRVKKLSETHFHGEGDCYQVALSDFLKIIREKINAK